MKKIVLFFLSLLLLTACSNSTGIKVNNNEFLSYEETKVFEKDTYFLDLYLDDDDHTLKVVGRLMYVIKDTDMDDLNIRFYPRAGNSDDFQLDYIKIDEKEVHLVWDIMSPSLMSYPLFDEYEVGDIIQIDFSYTFDYWMGEGRISYYDEYYITMFFYPFVQVNDDDMDMDYNYSFYGESYYNTIGDYYVSINAPKEYIVASSGKEVDYTDSRKRHTINYVLEDGRDFSFSASKNYHVYRNFDSGIEYSIYSIRELSETEINDNLDLIADAISTYSDYIGEYPYDHFTLELGNIYGMESSGIIYCSDDISEYTIVHEVVHQWLYSIIHNDQAREPFLDESLTTYITFIYFYETFGLEHANGYLEHRSSLKDGFEEYFEMYEGRSLLDGIHDYQTGYAYIIYYHGPTLYRYYFEMVAGDSDYGLLTDFLQAYYDEYAFKEVSTIEMLELLESITNIEGTKEWFLEEMESLRVPEPLE